MPDPDHDAEPERRTDPRYDTWPVERSGAYEQWPVERATPGETDPTGDPDLEWVGIFSPEGEAEKPYLYDPDQRTLVEGQVDEENERIVVHEASGRETESTDTLGEHLEAFGERHGLTGLAKFARENLDTGDDRSSGLTYDHSTFDRKNLVEDNEPDLAFVGSHTFADERGRTYVLEREFDAFLATGTDRATVEVREDARQAEGEKRNRQAGPAELTDQRTFELAFDVAAEDPASDERLAEAIEEWHRAHVGPAGDAGDDERAVAGE